MVGAPSDPSSLKEYLNKYRIADGMEKKTKKKRKVRSGIIVVDEDPIWQKPVKPEEDEEKYTDDVKLNKSGRTENQISDVSPPRRRRWNDTSPSSDLSPNRRSTNNLGDRDTATTPSFADLSPPRKKLKEFPISSHPKSGLISLQDFKAEIDKKRKEDWVRFNEMDVSVSGRGAEPIYRNKLTGERISKEEFLESRKKKLKKPKEKKLEWGKGLAQKRNFEARMQEMEAEKDRPFARSRDDPDLNAMLKERVRWGDPMADLIKKKHLGLILQDLGGSIARR
ncbi:hypothetical protein ACS0TY_021907 [Phlomoides rotata]